MRLDSLIPWTMPRDERIHPPLAQPADDLEPDGDRSREDSSVLAGVRTGIA